MNFVTLVNCLYLKTFDLPLALGVLSLNISQRLTSPAHLSLINIQIRDFVISLHKTFYHRDILVTTARDIFCTERYRRSLRTENLKSC